jgi:hypothetical protein
VWQAVLEQLGIEVFVSSLHGAVFPLGYRWPRRGLRQGLHHRLWVHAIESRPTHPSGSDTGRGGRTWFIVLRRKPRPRRQPGRGYVTGRAVEYVDRGWRSLTAILMQASIGSSSISLWVLVQQLASRNTPYVRRSMSSTPRGWYLQQIHQVIRDIAATPTPVPGRSRSTSTTAGISPSATTSSLFVAAL